jgi:acetyl-CoA acetyltransferase
MDYPIDGSDAVVVTTAERARDLPNKPVLIHAAVEGQTNNAVEENIPDLAHTGQQVAARKLWERSEVTLSDVDVYCPYDGFSPIELSWLEAIGYCEIGEGGSFIEDNWNKDTNRLEIGGRVLVNPHGGSLSEGATQGAGHTREAITQLRGEAEARQVPGARHALVTPGGFFFNAGGIMLRT